MEKLTSIYQDLYDNNVLMFDYRIPFSDAVVIELDGAYGLFVDTEQFTTIAEETVAVAHEAGHIFTGATYGFRSPFEFVQKQENRADKWAIKKLLPFEEMKEALESGLTSKFELAEHFGLTEDFVQLAFDYYTGSCGLNFNNSHV